MLNSRGRSVKFFAVLNFLLCSFFFVGNIRAGDVRSDQDANQTKNRHTADYFVCNPARASRLGHGMRLRSDERRDSG